MRPLNLALTLALLIGCSAPLPPSHDAHPVVAPTTAPIPVVDVSAAWHLDRDPAAVARITADVRFLASPALEGRGTGTEGAIRARDYVATRFTELGLEAAGESAGNAKGYLQKFSARTGAKADPAFLAIAPKRGKALDLKANAIVTAEGSATADVEAEAVLAGYGVTAKAVKYDDYEKVDVKGKIAVVFGGAPSDKALKDFGGVRYKLRTAREHGAVGVVIIEGDKLPDAPIEATSMGVPGVVASGEEGQKLLKAIGVTYKSAGDKASPTQKPNGAKLHLKTKIDPVDADAWNVLGVLRGSAHPDEYVVVGAHYDHLGHGGTSASRAPGSHEPHLGADDNASGTALMLEVARRFAKNAMRPARSLLFMGFGAEELGVLGSRHFVEHATVPLDHIVAMLNADMVGRMRDSRLLVDGLGTAAPWPDLVNSAGHDLGLDLAFGAEGFGASDHASFTASRVPVAFFFTGVHDDYHRPSDTADKINADGEEKVATLVARVAQRVADRTDRMAFVDAPADPHSGMRGGFKVSLGTMPDYAFQGPGLRLTGVRADSPAARAGLTGGDVILKIDTHDVTNIHDYMFALGELEPGREVTVEIDRGGKRTSLKIIPAPGK